MQVPKVPEIHREEFSPVVVGLLDVINYQSELIQTLKNEVAVLKGDKKPPVIKPSNLNKPESGGNTKKDGTGDGKRPGSQKKEKTKNLEIHQKIVCAADNVPSGSIFKGFKEFVVQGLIIQASNTLYRMERWVTPDGSYVQGKLPNEVNGHFDSKLISYIQYQYHQCHVTQPLLIEALREFGIDISSGQLNQIIVEGNEDFHEEKDEILKVGLEVSSYVNVDDTGARHDGKNGYCTHIGNIFFAWFGSTDSKSRINFLTLLQAGNVGYFFNEDALDYFKREKLPQSITALLQASESILFSSEIELEAHLKALGIEGNRHIRIIIEGTLIGNLFENGFNRDLAIISDDAGQFNILLHALCWVHAERLIHKLVPHTDEQRVVLNDIIDRIWKLYASLKGYKENPTSELKVLLENEFDEIFKGNTTYLTLNIALARLFKNKNELLLVLDRPDIPLHNNMSESDIREYVKKRKISGGTRSDAGKRARDTFTSLKKTARKLKVSFWNFLNDRHSGRNSIPKLGSLVREMASNSC